MPPNPNQSRPQQDRPFRPAKPGGFKKFGPRNDRGPQGGGGFVGGGPRSRGPMRRDDQPQDDERGRTDWSDVADWYDTYVGQTGSEYHREVIFPRLMKLLKPERKQRVLDVACGQGAWCRALAEAGCQVTGVDSAGPLVEKARLMTPQVGGMERIDYLVGDARELPIRTAEPFDFATCILAIQNIDPFEPVFQAVAKLLKPGGTFTLVMMHPAFRGPKSTHWEWDLRQRMQYRRVDRYLLPRREPIITHPGKKDGKFTWTFHRPIGDYVHAARHAGLLTDTLDEWASHKVSERGPRSDAENMAREEIPMFLTMRCVRG